MSVATSISNQHRTTWQGSVLESCQDTQQPSIFLRSTMTSDNTWPDGYDRARAGCSGWRPLADHTREVIPYLTIIIGCRHVEVVATGSRGEG